jgi:polyketide synthase PksN
VVEKTQYWEQLIGDDGCVIPRRAGVSSFGFGGTNAHVVLEEYDRPVEESREPDSGQQVIVLSARNEERLKEYVRTFLDYLDQDEGVGEEERPCLGDIAYTLQVGREPMEVRLAMVVSKVEELKEKLGAYVQGEPPLKDFYSGNGKVSRDVSQPLFKGEIGQEMIGIIVKNRDLGRLARLWVSGVDVDWQFLHNGRSRLRVALPTYPFSPQRYWLKNVSRAPVRYQGQDSPHPLIDRLDMTASLGQGLVLRKQFHQDEPVVKDHQLHGKSVLPGVTSLEMARAAFSFSKCQEWSENFGLDNFVWLQPLVMDEETREVFVAVKQ